MLFSPIVLHEVGAVEIAKEVVAAELQFDFRRSPWAKRLLPFRESAKFVEIVAVAPDDEIFKIHPLGPPTRLFDLSHHLLEPPIEPVAIGQCAARGGDEMRLDEEARDQALA